MVSNAESKFDPLIADGKHQAINPIGGYVYQIWQSVFAWLNLGDDEYLYIEGAEDFDIYSSNSVKTVQVKKTQKKITLRSNEIISAITHFGELRKNNPNRKIIYRFLTTSSVVIEKGGPLGSNVKGLDLWDKAFTDTVSAMKIIDFLINENKLPQEQIDYLKNTEVEKIQQELFKCIKWDIEQKSVDYIKEAINHKLIVYGNKLGIPASESKKTLNRLFTEVIELATKKSDRLLSKSKFLEIFEEENYIPIPKSKIPLLSYASDISNLQNLQIIDKKYIITPQRQKFIRVSIPPINTPYINRSNIVNVLCDLLATKDILLLSGSTGMGKTTIAKLVVKKLGQEWYWCCFTEVDKDKYYEYFSLIFEQTEESGRKITNYVFDDINISLLGDHNLLNTFGGLVYTLQERKIKLLITSKTNVPHQFLNNINYQSFHNENIKPFSHDEIKEFSMQFDCPDGSTAELWAPVIEVQTRGHPQLIHAILADLKKLKWPDIRLDDFYKKPLIIDNIQDDIRLVLNNTLSDNQLELLYHLSLVFGRFNREQAILIGDIHHRISHPGDDFDYLLGPWIESLHDNFFQVSPLLSNIAKKIWSDQTISSLHSQIATQLSMGKRITPRVANQILFHSWIGKNTTILISIIHALIVAEDKVWKYITNNLSWLIHIGTNPIQPPIPDDKLSNFMFRQLQFKIASETDLNLASQIATAWEKELTQYKPIESYKINRLYLVVLILSNHKVYMEPGILVSLLVEAYDLKESIHNILKKHYSNVGETISFKDFPVDTLLTSIILRCKSTKFLTELLETLDKVPAVKRNILLEEVNKNESDAELLITNSYSDEAEKENPDWDNCIKSFEKTFRYGLHWNIPNLSYSAIRGIVVIHNEYLNNPDKALSLLRTYSKRVSPSVLLEDSRARVLFDMRQYKAALSIWDTILSKWLPPPEYNNTGPVFSCRLAAIAAYKVCDYDKSARLFTECRKRSEEINLTIFPIAFLADAAFAYWMNGDYSKSVDCFHNSIIELSKVADHDEDTRVYQVNKTIGHLLLWIYRAHNSSPTILAEPFPGMCSNPLGDERIRELPKTPIDYQLITVVQIEDRLGLPPTYYEEHYQTLKESNYLLVRLFIRLIQLKHKFNTRSFESLPSVFNEIEGLFSVIKKHDTKGDLDVELPLIQSDREIDVPILSILEPDLFVAAIFLILFENSEIETTIIEWEKEAKKIISNKLFLEFIYNVRHLLSLKRNEVLNALKNSNEISYKRNISALSILFDRTENPDDLFYAQTLLLFFFINIEKIFSVDLSKEFSHLISIQWLKIIKSPFKLSTPRITVPDIESACNSQSKGFKKAGEIILAASNTVSTRLTQEVHDQIKSMISSNTS